MSYVKITKEKNYISLFLNRPEKRNALNQELVSELLSYLNEYEEDKAINFITISGTGSTFSAGADLDYIKKISSNSYEENLADTNHLKSLFERIYHYHKPVIAVVNGHAIAGGCGLASVCDVILAKETALFGYTEVKIGFIAALVMVYLQKYIGEKKAMDLLLTGKLIDANEAASIGLISNVFEEKSFENDVANYLEALLKNSPNSLIETKKLFRNSANLNHKDALELAAAMNANIRQHADCQEGITAFLEKRKPIWK